MSEMAVRLRTLENRITRLEDLLEAATAERDQLAKALDALEFRAYDAEKRLRKLDGMALGDVGE